MERTLDAGPVVVAELTYVVGHMLQVGRRDRMVGQQHLAPGNARFRLAPEVEHDLEQLTGVGALVQGPRELRRKRPRQELDLLVPVGGA